ncbi:MAG TPA: GNAT family N-acetyltransferase [Hyphomicrobium sp.]|jgi:GNAT superfamily N-acetyltransferase
MTDARTETLRSSGVTFEAMTPFTAETLGPLLARIDPWDRHKYTPSALTAYLAAEEPGAPRFAINVGRGHAGAIGIKRDWLRGPYLQFLGLLPAYQRQGIGTSVLDWFESEARATRAQNLWVAASDFNARALSFYEKHGFSRVATLDALVTEGSSEILLRKRLVA